VADLVVNERSDDGGFQAEAFAETAGGIVFAAAFPDLEVPGGADAALAGIEAKHDFAEGDLVKGAGGGGFDLEAHNGREMEKEEDGLTTKYTKHTKAGELPTEHTEYT
jgi:hypothetical protein